VDDGQARAGLLDDRGAARADQAATFRAAFTGLGGTLRCQPTVREPWQRTQTALDHLLAVEEIALPGGPHALLAMAVDPNASVEEALAGQALLGACAQRLALGLTQEARDQSRRAHQDERAALSALAYLGELAGPVAHEFNNFLNVLLLHIAILEQEVPPALRPELEQITRQGKDVAGVIRQWQLYRRDRQATPHPIHWEQVLRRVVEEVIAGGATVRLHLSPEVPPILAAAHDLERLSRLLLGNAVAAAGPDGDPVHVYTGTAASNVLLTVRDAGPPIPLDALTEVFELTGPVREGTNRLELAACRSLARRLQGSVRAENLSQGGVAMIVSLPAAGTPPR